MAIRTTGQLGFADQLVRGHGGVTALDRAAQRLDWAPLEALVAPLRDQSQGRPGYPPLIMLKALILQNWYGLGDPELEIALADRISFRRFCGLSLQDETPDHSTIWRFRNSLDRDGIAEHVFAEVTRQLDGRGMVLRKGTLIDASLVEAAVKRPAPPKDASPGPAAADETADETVDETATPDATADGDAACRSVEPATPAAKPPSKLVGSEHDTDAAWARKGGKRYFGYKIHVGVDQGSGIIRRALLTPANVNDTTPADALICGDEGAVYADMAYGTKKRSAALAAKGIRDRIMTRPNKHHPLTPRQQSRNKAIGRRRAPVEQIFARLKGLHAWSRARYRGLARNAIRLWLSVTAMNMRKLAMSGA